MISGVVISDGSVKASGARRKIRIRLVGELIPLNVDAELVGRVGTEHNFRQEAQVIGELGSDEQIKLTGLKGSVGRRRRIPTGSTSVVDDRKDQRICDGSHSEV